MIRNAKVGDRVRCLPQHSHEQTLLKGGVVVGHWPAGAREGTVMSIWRKPNFVFIEVAADHPKAVGSMPFQPKDLERIK